MREEINCVRLRTKSLTLLRTLSRYEVRQRKKINTTKIPGYDALVVNFKCGYKYLSKV